MVGHFVVVDDVHVFDDAHFLLLRSEPSFVVIIEILRQRIDHIIVEVEIAGVGVPHAMGRLVVHQKTERFVFVALVLHPIDGQIGNDIGDIALALQFFPIAKEIGVVVIALVDEDIPIVKPGGQRSQMPFANHGRLIARALQEFRKSLLIAVKSFRVIRKPIGVAVFSREHAGTRRAAE